MQKVSLELDHQRLFCPVTGVEILPEEGPFQSSPALAFCFLPEIGEFEHAAAWVTEAFQRAERKWEEREERGEGDGDYPFDIMVDEELSEMSNLVLFSITNRGFACGPVSHTVYFCFDMNYMPEEE